MRRGEPGFAALVADMLGAACPCAPPGPWPEASPCTDCPGAGVDWTKLAGAKPIEPTS